MGPHEDFNVNMHSNIIQITQKWKQLKGSAIGEYIKRNTHRRTEFVYQDEWTHYMLPQKCTSNTLW